MAINSRYLKLGMAAAALFAAGSIHAATVDYTTTATFTCVGCTIVGNDTGNVVVTYGSGAHEAVLTFTGAPAGTSVVDDGSGSGAGYGTIKTTSTAAGTDINGSFKLNIFQTNPASGNGSFPVVTTTAGITGHINNSGSTGFIDFGSQNPSFTLPGNVSYELDTSKKGSKFGYTIVAPTSGVPAGTTTFQGTITAAATPEPTFLTLTGAGFIGLAAFALRRRKQNA